MRGEACDFLVPETDGTTGDPDQVLHDAAHGAGLAGAIAAHNADHFAVTHLEINAMQGLTLPVGRLDLFKDQHQPVPPR